MTAVQFWLKRDFRRPSSELSRLIQCCSIGGQGKVGVTRVVAVKPISLLQLLPEASTIAVLDALFVPLPFEP